MLEYSYYRVYGLNYLFRRKAFGLSPYWPTNAELLPYGSFVTRATFRGKLFPSSFFPQLLSVGLVSTAAHSLRTDGRLVPKGQTGNSPMLQHWECVTKDQPSPGGTAALEPGAFDWRRPQPSLRDSDTCDWPPHPNTEVLGYCHASLRDIRIGCGALTFLSAAELREAFGVRGACSRFRIAGALRQRQQAGRTPNASRGSSLRLDEAAFNRWVDLAGDCPIPGRRCVARCLGSGLGRAGRGRGGGKGGDFVLLYSNILAGGEEPS